jgi:MFS family permease
LIGTLASVAGNEASIRFGRRRLIVTAMLLSVVVGSMIGLVGSLSYAAATVLVIVYGVVIWLDSSSLTAGTAGTAEPSRRGATLAVHSMLGYGGGFVGPIIVGNVLDWSGGMSVRAWWLGFGVVSVLMTVALAVFIHMQPRNIAGETD